MKFIFFRNFFFRVKLERIFIKSRVNLKKLSRKHFFLCWDLSGCLVRRFFFALYFLWKFNRVLVKPRVRLFVFKKYLRLFKFERSKRLRFLKNLSFYSTFQRTFFLKILYYNFFRLKKFSLSSNLFLDVFHRRQLFFKFLGCRNSKNYKGILGITGLKKKNNSFNSNINKNFLKNNKRR